jgi:hypothetical protein
MIEYLTVCYKNYDLISMQIDNFRKRFNHNDYRLIVVDNTPDEQKQPHQNKIFRESGIVDLLIEIPSSDNQFDAVSHGGALDAGLKYCDSDIICIFDSDFFILDNDMNEYILNKFNQGYDAVGATFDCSSEHRMWINKAPNELENIPAAWCGFYSKSICKSDTWVLTNQECNLHKSIKNNTFITTGWRIRKYIIDNNLKTMVWDTNHVVNGDIQYFTNESNKLVGVHGWCGSHRDNTIEKNNKLRSILNNIA